MTSYDVGLPLMTVLAILTLSGFATFRSFRAGRLLTGVGGLHVNVFLCLGFGPLAYLLFTPPQESFPYESTVSYFPYCGGYFLIGYVTWIALEVSLARGAAISPVVLARKFETPLFLTLTGASLIGYLGATLELSQSGFGTIFPTLKLLLYPTFTLAMLRIRRGNANTGLLAGGLGTILFLLSFFSGWRSELIITAVCVLVALAFHYPRTVLPVAAAGALIAWIVFPFLQVKKLHYEQFQLDPIGTLIESQSITTEERTDLLASFLATRVNYLREMAYVVRGIDMRTTFLRNGESYVESVTQLIPRIVWSEKPSFNYLANRTIPKEIGLVGRDDNNTSWGVNVFAEMTFNFPVENLIWFVPIIFGAFAFIEKCTALLLHQVGTRLLAGLFMFNLTIQITSLVNIGTYIIWVLLFLWVFDRRVVIN